MTFQRWAIQVVGSATGCPNFIGCGWRFDGKPSREPYPYVVPPKLFVTRREAREALKSVKGPKERGRFPSAKVVRVTVEVST
jgi:hypothetical protein